MAMFSNLQFATFFLIVTMCTNAVIVNVCVSLDWVKEMPGWSTIANTLSVLVSFLISTRFSMACDRSHTIMDTCYQLRRAVTVFNKTFRKAETHTLEYANCLDDIIHNTIIYETVITKTKQKIRPLPPGAADTITTITTLMDTAIVAFHHSGPRSFNALMYTLLYVFYGMLLPISSISEFGRHAIYVTNVIAVLNYAILYNAIEMDHPIPSMKASIQKKEHLPTRI